MIASTPSRPQRGRAPYSPFSGRAAALYSGFRCVRRCAQQSARAIARPPIFPLPPVPPASGNSRRTALPLEKGGQQGCFSRGEGGGSADNSWFSGGVARKSLILEASAAMSHPVFATSRAVFATSRFFRRLPADPFFSLSKLLKKKKKEYVEGREISRKGVPLVGRVLPLVADAAYFLGHESEGGATCF